MCIQNPYVSNRSDNKFPSQTNLSLKSIYPGVQCGSIIANV